MNFANDTKVDPSGKLIGDPTESQPLAEVWLLTTTFDVRLLKDEPRVADCLLDSEQTYAPLIHKEADGTSHFYRCQGCSWPIAQGVTQRSW